MLLHTIFGLAMFGTCIVGMHVSNQVRQTDCDELGNYPPYTGPCEPESKRIDGPLALRR
jgi:hypothetical protein